MTKSLDIIYPRDIAALENCSITQAYRKFRYYKSKLNLLSTNRKYITVNELAHCLNMTIQADIEQIKINLRTR